MRSEFLPGPIGRCVFRRALSRFRTAALFSPALLAAQAVVAPAAGQQASPFTGPPHSLQVLVSRTQSVQPGARVSLAGAARTTPDAHIVAYRWRQASGPAVQLSDPRVAQPSFIAPRMAATLTFYLTVSDSLKRVAGAATQVRVGSTGRAASRLPVKSQPASRPMRDPAGVFNPDGSVNPMNYRKLAAHYGTAAMIPFRFGKDWHAYHAIDPSAGAPTWWERPHQWARNAANPNEHLWWELTPDSGYSQTDVGDFSSNQGAIGYVSDPAVPKTYNGVDSIATYLQSRHIIGQRPQCNWTYGCHPAPGLTTANGHQTKVVGITRAYGNSENAVDALIVFQDGEIATSSFNTGMHAYTAHLLPANLVPTAVSVTNSGEFALITCWDTTNLKGVLAVVALGAKIPPNTYWGVEWKELYPGFQNASGWSFSKLLGTIDLGMAAPTSIEAVGNHSGWPGANPRLYGWPLGGDHPVLSTNQSIWQTFRPGGRNYGQYSHHGFALVASRYEREVAIIDLSPLFQKVEKVMFGNYARFLSTVIHNTGPGAKQWPYTFNEAPDFKPKRVKTLRFAREVTAVSASLWAEDKGLVATEDGVLHILDMDGLQTGGTGVNTHQIASIRLGRNITQLGHMRHYPRGNQTNDGAIQHVYLAFSRGDKRIDWVSFKNGWASPQILRTLRDSRLVDPIGGDDNPNHGVQLDLVNVTDFGAKKVRAYRYGPTIWITWLKGATVHCGPNGTDPYEYGGDYPTPAGPWVINNQNIL